MSNEIQPTYGQMTKTENATVAVAQSREMAATLAKMQRAIQFPRDVRRAIDRITNACQRVRLAEVATYTYNRGGTDITGPSIRLAEAIAQNWGNIDHGIEEIEQRDGESTVRAYAIDLETNTTSEKIFQVKHIRYTKSKGAVRLVDPRDIYEKVANDGARRLRACILAVIPSDIIEEAVDACEETLKASVNVTKERIDAMIDKFSDFDVTREMIETRIQRNISAITPAQFLGLVKVYNSMKDGMSKREDWFTVQPASEQVKPDGDATKKTSKGLKEALGIKGAKGNAEVKVDEGTEGTDKKDEVKSEKSVDFALI